MDQIKIHFPDGLKTFGQKRILRDDPEYFLEPHEPRELLLDPHLLKFLVKYLLSMQNEAIEILISKECDDYLEEHNYKRHDLSKLDPSHLVSFKNLVQK